MHEGRDDPIADEVVLIGGRASGAGDQAAFRGGAELRIFLVKTRGLALRAGAGLRPILVAIGPCRLRNAVAVEIFHRAEEMAASAEQRGAEGKFGLVAGGIAVIRDAGIDVEFEALVALVEHEIDDAGDGIGAIDRRGAAGHDIHPVDQHLRQRVDRDRAVCVGRRQAMRHPAAPACAGPRNCAATGR